MSLEPQCDSPAHLPQRAYVVIDYSSDAAFVMDFAPAEVVANLKSSILWTSETLLYVLRSLLSTAIPYNDLNTDVVDNVSAKIERLTNQKITNDFSLLQTVDHHQDMLPDMTPVS